MSNIVLRLRVLIITIILLQYNYATTIGIANSPTNNNTTTN